LNEKKSSRETDLERLSQLKALSWLSPSELTLLVRALTMANYKRHAVILSEVALAQDAHILLAGIARITCHNARNERVTVALLAPGPIPEFPALPLSQSGFQCEAYNDCRVGTVSCNDFDGITPQCSRVRVQAISSQRFEAVVSAPAAQLEFPESSSARANSHYAAGTMLGLWSRGVARDAAARVFQP